MFQDILSFTFTENISAKIKDILSSKVDPLKYVFECNEQ